ncbi:MAG: tRNA lysidine(34) synthetase TilS, partial [Bacillus sp. (in: Bacteria)]|nr:tRNA lysidine(34) synthetase TilS [Bacillus sp. (in: firmicutes)]
MSGRRKTEMEDIYEKVKKYIAEKRMITAGDIVVAGVSGGADSVCMLYLLSELAKETDFCLLAVHVHHGVRIEADEDADYVESLCERLGLPYFYKKVDMIGYAKANKMTPEEAGRVLRYQAFEEVLAAECGVGGVGKIAVAHNRNDRAETMLFHLFRGSGLRGLAGIRPVRGQVIRPLLCLDRAEIESYLESRHIVYCSDSTNEKDDYTRNKIRHHVIPYVETQICANVTAHMNAAADILAETDDYIQRQADISYEKCLLHSDEEQKTLDLCLLRKEDIFLQKMVLLRCMEKLTPYRKDITKEHIYALLELIGKDGSRELSLPYRLTAHKEYDKLTLCLEQKGDKEGTPGRYLPYSVSVPGQVTVPGLGAFTFQLLRKEDFFYKKGQIIPEKTYTKWFDYDKITAVLLLRTR